MSGAECRYFICRATLAALRRLTPTITQELPDECTSAQFGHGRWFGAARSSTGADAAAEAVEEAIINAILAGEDMTTADGVLVPGLDGHTLLEAMRQTGWR